MKTNIKDKPINSPSTKRVFYLGSTVKVTDPDSEYYGRVGEVWRISNYLPQFGVVLDKTEDNDPLHRRMVNIDIRGLKCIDIPANNIVMAASEGTDLKDLRNWVPLLYVGNHRCHTLRYVRVPGVPFDKLRRKEGVYFRYIVGVYDFDWERPELNVDRSI